MDKSSSNYDNLQAEFVQTLLGELDSVKTEIEERNENIKERDDYIYGDRIEKSLDTPMGHDKTPINWLKRAVEIHRDQFMGRGFQVISTYNVKDVPDDLTPEEASAAEVENSRNKAFAEQRKNLIDGIIEDNGGHQLFKELAESAGAIGDAVLKAYYDEDDQKYVLSPIEAVENFYAIWSSDNFREASFYAFINQESKMDVLEDYPSLQQDIPTSPLGAPLKYAEEGPSNYTSSQPMVTIIEGTGKIPGFKSQKGRLSKCKIGQETELNVKIVANKIVRLIDDPKKIPNYYILPNKRQRRRPWGASDISDAAININQTYVETLSDWRTLASKVNFPKIKAFNFPTGADIPKPKPRSVEILPLGEGQDLQLLNLGDANQFDFKAQLDELKEQFVRETAISRVFFDDPSVTLNSNQALMTSIKPTTDVAEAKKALWQPILTQIFKDAITTLALVDSSVKQIAEGDWTLRIMYPSVLQKEDPVYQQMLLNRFNANTISLQSYLEAQGESKEEVDRIKDELKDKTTAAILGKQVGAKVQMEMQQEMMEAQQQQQQMMGQPPMAEDQRNQVTTQAENQPGTGVVSQPGSGQATPVSAEGAVNMNQQQMLGA